ncbi:MAG: class I SAM-dependent methyltransferase [bacterium]|nr:class I SAM-dependent methyltransferase [bacterium]
MEHLEHSQPPSPQMGSEATDHNRQEISADLESVLKEFFYPKEEVGISSSDDAEDTQALFDIYSELLHDKNYFERVPCTVDMPGGETMQDSEDSLYELLMEMIAGYKILLSDLEREAENTRIVPKLPVIRKRFDRIQEIARRLEEDPRFHKVAEEVEQKKYEEYLSHLGITEKELKSANRVLDVGAGDRLFASHCLRKKIHSEVYSIEPYLEDIESEGYRRVLWTPEIQKQIDGRTIQGISEELPLKDGTFDLILMHYFPKKTVEMSYDELIRVLRPDGEMRLYPFISSLRGKDNAKKTTLKHLRALEKSGRCKVTVEPLKKEEADGHDGWERVIVRKIQ